MAGIPRRTLSGMTERYDRARDLDSWRHDRRIAERGFVHAWHSAVAPGNGEDYFVDRLSELLGPDDVVLDLGCGHGELALDLAGRCDVVIGMDRDPRVLGLARELAAERGVANALFVEFDFRAGAAPADLPVADGSVTAIVNRRGPTADKWLGWVRSAARPGCTALVMHPAGGPPAPRWSIELPAELRDSFGEVPYDEVRSWVERPLAAEGITDYRLWWFDVPEWFTTAGDLHARLAGTADPPAARLAELREIIARYGDTNGLALRHQRLVAEFRLPG